jgi:G patch domain-containing protein 1
MLCYLFFLNKDAFPRKKPFSLKDQVATDKYGRRRFHGAFTGGFSAGFFNSVGSLEGWTPSTFKSSRSDKARNMPQKPEDFMDEEVTFQLDMFWIYKKCFHL